MRDGVWVVIKLCAPMLLLSMAVGVLLAIFQAVTQIHEQTLSGCLWFRRPEGGYRRRYSSPDPKDTPAPSPAGLVLLMPISEYMMRAETYMLQSLQRVLRLMAG